MRASLVRSRYLFVIAALLGLVALIPLPADGQTGGKKGTGRCFLWKVTSPTTTVYLLGSMHVAKTNLFPLPAEIEEAYARSAKLVVEVNTEAVDQVKLQQALLDNAKYPDGDMLSKNLPKTTMDALERYCGKKGIPIADLEPMRPWLVSMLITLEEAKAQGFSDNGIDKHFLTKAISQQKPIVELETAQTQLSLFTRLSDDYQEKLLAKTLSEVRSIKTQMEKMTAAWKAGDAKTLEDMILSDEIKQHPERKGLMVKIFDERNVKMTARIDKLLQGDDPCFVVVGAGHLVGEKGIVKLLEKRNYEVEQVSRGAAKR